jgi:oligosaccharide reducing-end xylanase
VCSTAQPVVAESSRTVFDQIGVPADSVQARIEQTWKAMTEGDSTNARRIYFEREDNSAYILTPWNGRVLSPSQGMAMMAGVLLDDQEKFDRLWKFARENMYHTDGKWQGYFAFHTLPDGTIFEKKQKAWGLGEAYITTALIGAHKRWGSGKGLKNYKKQAQTLLKHFVEDADTTANGALFHKELKYPLMLRRSGETKTVVAFHTPAFFDLWSQWSGDKAVRAFFAKAARNSREYLQKASALGSYSLFPMFTTVEYGLEKEGDGHHDNFHPASYPAVLHVALDGIVGKPQPWQTQLADTVMQFFHSRGLDNWGYHYHIMNGKQLSEGEVNPDLAAVTASLAALATVPYQDEFVEFVWNYPYEHAPGLVYLLSMQAMNGAFGVLY